MTVVPDQHRATIASLPIDPVEAQPRQVFFFDTPDLRLNKAGVVVRARRIQGGRGDTVVKLRPVVPDELPPELRRSPSFNVEVDILPGLIGVCSASLKGRASGAEIARRRARRTCLCGSCSRRISAPSTRSTRPPISTSTRCSCSGPRSSSSPCSRRRSMRPPVRRGAWFYPDGTRILELSTKCLPNEAVAGRARGPDIP